MQTVTEKAAGLGVQLNHSKSEIVGSDSSAIAAMIKVVPDLCPVTPENAHLLRSSTGRVEEIDDAISENIGALETMGDRLCHLRAHDAYGLLRNSFTHPKLLYTLRMSRCSKSPQLRHVDSLLWSLLGGIANITIANNDVAWSDPTFLSGPVAWVSGV